MPFIELVFTVILVVIVTGIAAVVLVYAAGVGVILLGALLLLGWIPILMCASDIHMNIGEGFWGTLALYATWLYAICALGLASLMIVRPDPDGLPPAWKFLAMFYRAGEARKVSAERFDAGAFGHYKEQPAGTYAKRMWAGIFAANSAKMTERRAHMEKETANYLDSMRRQAEEADKLHRAQARRDGAREWMEENHGRQTKGN